MKVVRATLITEDVGTLCRWFLSNEKSNFPPFPSLRVHSHDQYITVPTYILSTDDYLTMEDSSNRSYLGAKSSHFQAKIRSHTRLYFKVALIKNTECSLLSLSFSSLLNWLIHIVCNAKFNYCPKCLSKD